MTTDHTFQQAVAFHKTGRFQDAEQLYFAVLQAEPVHPDANYNMGLLVMQMGYAAASLQYFLAALEADPAHGQYWIGYIDALYQSGQLTDAEQILALARQQGLQGAEVEALAQKIQLAASVVLDAESAMQPVECPSAQQMDDLASLYGQRRLNEAITLAQQMTERYPLHEFGWNALGAILHEFGQMDVSETSFRQALQINPVSVDAHGKLANVLCDMGRLEEAEAGYRRALQIDPDNTEVYNNLGNMLKGAMRLEEAQVCFAQAIRVNPGIAELHFNRANTLRKMNRLAEAEAGYREAIRIRPDYVEAHGNLGFTIMDLYRFAEAEACFRRAIEINPDSADAHRNLGANLMGLGRLDEGAACYRRAVELKPDSAELHDSLGNSLRDIGRLDDAVACYRNALKLKPDFALAHSNLIFTLDLATDISVAAMQQERKKWGEIHAAHFLPPPPHRNDPEPERRLRIGYVSTDFSTNSAPTVFAAMLFNYDRSNFDVITYSNDTWTSRLAKRIEQNATEYRHIYGQSDDDVADLIREDRIDILVDLSGHSRENRLMVFARKPAPIQITAWGYSTGTGMKAIDVLFSDPLIIPPEEKPLYAEQIRYLPSFMPYYPGQTPPEVNELPALSSNVITFCTFSRLERVSEEAYRTWARVLLAVPNSRMLFKNTEMDHADARARVLAHFTRAGIDPERIILKGRTSWEEHMAVFNQVDIALDPFPQCGGVTTLEGFMMGLPIITLRWPIFGGRMGASFLTNLGLSDWIAETTDQYVEIAKQKAKDIASLAELRAGLRERLMTSIICDADAYARTAEREFRQLWREWCARQQPAV